MFELDRSERLREEFVKHGVGLGLRGVADYIIDNTDLYDVVEDGREALLQKVIADLRRALKVKDERGLPFAGPTTSRDINGSPIWAMRQLWLLPDYDEAYTEYEDGEHESRDLKLKIADECFERYGRRPQRTHPPRHFASDDNGPAPV